MSLPRARPPCGSLPDRARAWRDDSSASRSRTGLQRHCQRYSVFLPWYAAQEIVIMGSYPGSFELRQLSAPLVGVRARCHRRASYWSGRPRPGCRQETGAAASGLRRYLSRRQRRLFRCRRVRANSTTQARSKRSRTTSRSTPVSRVRTHAAQLAGRVRSAHREHFQVECVRFAVANRHFGPLPGQEVKVARGRIGE